MNNGSGPHKTLFRRIVVLSFGALVACGDTDEISDLWECSTSDCVLPAELTVCRGNLLYTSPAQGICEDNRCVYEPVVVDCAASNQICVSGACQAETPPCEGVECIDPPDAECDGDVVVSYAATGTCAEADGTCTYESNRTDCTESGQACRGGACVELIDPCAGVDCSEPPAPDCRSGSVITSSDGVCVEGRCEFTETERDCSAEELFCNAGECVPEDPCLEVVCDAPPAETCVGDDLVFNVGAGLCVDGECEWDQYVVDCTAAGMRCVDSECVVPDPCEGVDCSVPPASECRGQTAISFAGGTCAEGTCSFDETAEDCSASEKVCLAGVCVTPDPCEGVLCETPPTSFCADDILQTFDSAGVCTGGECSYAVIPVDCTAADQVCRNGACITPDPCEGVLCETPPAAFCVDDILQTFDSAGVCDGGECSYDVTPVDCAASEQVCRDGACVTPDPCEGVLCETPPAPFCANDILQTFDPAGVCDGGECSYTERAVDCAATEQVCRDAACVTPDPCEGIVCEQASSCDGDIAVVVSGLGTCSFGECDFSEVTSTVDCAQDGLRCLSGACVPPAYFLSAGDLIVTEILREALPESGEVQWFEIAEARGEQVAIGGLEILDHTGAAIVLPNDVLLEPWQHLTFAAANVEIGGIGWGVYPNFVWDGSPGFTLGVPDGSLTLVGGDTVVAELQWDASWPAETDNSVQLDPASYSSGAAVAANWCVSGSFTGKGSPLYGSAGVLNSPCPGRIEGADLLITEIMYNGTPNSGSVGEYWLEIYNRASTPVDLAGLRITAFGFELALPPSTVVAGNDFFVVAADENSAGGEVDFVAGESFQFNASFDSVSLYSTHFGVSYSDIFWFLDGGFPETPNASMERGWDALDLDPYDATNWCAGSELYSGDGANLGTPGAVNTCTVAR